MHWNNGWGMMMGGGWFVWFLLLILIGLIVWMFLRSASVRGTPSGSSPPKQETPLEILQKRYAQGEISRQEYEQMRGDLEASHTVQE